MEPEEQDDARGWMATLGWFAGLILVCVLGVLSQIAIGSGRCGGETAPLVHPTSSLAHFCNLIGHPISRPIRVDAFYAYCWFPFLIFIASSFVAFARGQNKIWVYSLPIALSVAVLQVFAPGLLGR